MSSTLKTSTGIFFVIIVARERVARELNDADFRTAADTLLAAADTLLAAARILMIPLLSWRC